MLPISLSTIVAKDEALLIYLWIEDYVESGVFISSSEIKDGSPCKLAAIAFYSSIFYVVSILIIIIINNFIMKYGYQRVQ